MLAGVHGGHGTGDERPYRHGRNAEVAGAWRERIPGLVPLFLGPLTPLVRLLLPLSVLAGIGYVVYRLVG